jgi:hypothetical protein
MDEFKVLLISKCRGLLDTLKSPMSPAQEAGLVSYFWRDIPRTSNLKGSSIHIQTFLDDYKVFTLTYLYSVFFLICLVHFCVFCLLIPELSCHWYVERQHKLAVKTRRQRRKIESNRNLVALRKELF